MDGSTTLDDTRPTRESDMSESPNQPEELLESTESPVPADSAPPDETDAGTESADERREAQTDGPTADPIRIVEAVLMAAESPMTAGKIASIVGEGTGRDVKKHIQALNANYDEWGLSFCIEEVAGGFQILTRPAYNPWLTKLLRVRQETKLSPAAMETLAIIAYKQPCTRAEVEAVRGVAAGEMINRLREMNIVKIAGRAEDLGRPLLYGTTRKFLEVFGLPSLEDLPQVEALRPASAKAPKPDIDETMASADEDDNPTDSPASDATDAEESTTAETPTDAVEATSPDLHIVHDDEEESEEARD